ncbi:uncharacterized protein I206_107824 [Kwoniella pini CBS 10737]|uniref:Uncharacterized protein n=1 Tax=Kwoniella pini CBS 10737 TaxID=1296096 RepID=A0A1B9HYC7_9TREE|nr:uncharacterized protein I206_06157 [Kwoniella pini CBS 10737]OCF48289.1 hypothetical protein I206_06157 [Kwoniella pini CBS 10737]
MVNLNPISTVSGSSLIGVGIACGGNILISLALTLQKLAHRKNEERAQKNHIENGNNGEDDDDDDDDDSSTITSNFNIRSKKQNGHIQNVPSPIPEEETPCPSPHSQRSNFDEDEQNQAVKALPIFLVQDSKSKSSSNSFNSPSSSITPITKTQSKQDNGNDRSSQEEEDQIRFKDDEVEHGGQVKEGEYLKSKLWWLGQILITVGEGGNFLSYGFAPASVVAPLGTVALIANCIFAPLVLREKFHKRELFGMALAIIGAITVVYSSNGSNPRLNPDQLISALKRIPFIIYTILTVILLITLILLSNSSYGHKYLLIDIGVCTLFGGYTVLSTKALSSLLSNDFIGSWNFGITWFLLIMVASTSIGQVRWLNRALMNFQSKEVIPTQFVFFSLAAIIGSAVLYEEFKDVSFSSFVNFAFGIATTFLGVHLLTSTTSSNESSNEEIEESINSNLNRPILQQRATSSASLNLLLPSSTSLNSERTPLLISSSSNWQISQQQQQQQQQSQQQNTIYTPGLGTTPNNKVRLVRIGSNGEFSPALGIGSQAGLLLLATTPPTSGILHRGRSSSKTLTLGTNPNSNSNGISDEELGRSDGDLDKGKNDRRDTSPSRRTNRV